MEYCRGYLFLFALLFCALQVLPTNGDLPDPLRDSLYPASERTSPSHILLLHGATQGAFVWYKVSARLRCLGHKVTAVDLGALGNDATGVADVTSIRIWAKNAITFINGLPRKKKVVIAAHSGGGLVAQYLSENYPKKVRAAVYIAAVLPGNGESAITYVNQPDSGLVGHVVIDFAGNTANVDDPNILKTVFCPDCSSQDVTLLQTLYRPQPLKPLLENVTITTEKFDRVPRYWVRSTKDAVLTPAAQNLQIGNIGGFSRIFDLESGHQVQLVLPNELAQILHSI